MAELCRNQYERIGGKEVGDRLVQCDLPRGHDGYHEETETGSKWPPLSRAALGVAQDDPRERVLAHYTQVIEDLPFPKSEELADFSKVVDRQQAIAVMRAAVAAAFAEGRQRD